MELTIITGRRDSGKTSWCVNSLIDGSFDGILMPKVFVSGEFQGFDARRISTGQSVPLLRFGPRESFLREPHAPGPSAEKPPARSAEQRIGRFSICRPGLEKTRAWIEEAVAGPSVRLLIDEVGRLELRGGGFAEQLSATFECGGDRGVYLVVRRDFVEDVMRKFRISRASLVEVEGGRLLSRSTLVCPPAG
ncbi:MAG TPA: nucleoside-triphosphatase [Spirochaetia bacterium]|nr:nucleoside-triphosphatase [Spirochaetia bacterium]